MLLNYHLYRLSSIRHYFTTEATTSAINALLTSRLDYCNSLLVNLPASQIFRLQRIRNYTARLITRTSRHDHITPVLMGLHWLPVASRIHFKVLVLASMVWRRLTCPNSYTYELLTGAYARTMRQHSLKTHLFISHIK